MNWSEWDKSVAQASSAARPKETVFDAMPGDLFVLRNAGNTCALDSLDLGAAPWAQSDAL